MTDWRGVSILFTTGRPNNRKNGPPRMTQRRCLLLLGWKFLREGFYLGQFGEQAWYRTCCPITKIGFE